MLAHRRVDITSARFKADPFSFYESLRRDDPVCSIVLPNGTSAWLISRYDDVVSALKDPRLVKNRRNVPGAKKAGLAWTPKMFEPLTRNMLDSDPPDHSRLRILVHKAFTPRVIESLHDRIVVVANQLLDDITSNQSVDQRSPGTRQSPQGPGASHRSACARVRSTRRITARESGTGCAARSRA